MLIKDEDLCKDLPKQFLQFLKRVRSYGEEDVPEYDELKSLLQCMSMFMQLRGIESFRFKKECVPWMDWSCPIETETRSKNKLPNQAKDQKESRAIQWKNISIDSSEERGIESRRKKSRVKVTITVNIRFFRKRKIAEIRNSKYW